MKSGSLGCSGTAYGAVPCFFYKINKAYQRGLSHTTGLVNASALQRCLVRLKRSTLGREQRVSLEKIRKKYMARSVQFRVHRALPVISERSVLLGSSTTHVPLVCKASIVLLTKTGPRCISFRCKITVSLAQGAVHDAEADVADPVFVRSTIELRALPSLSTQLLRVVEGDTRMETRGSR